MPKFLKFLQYDPNYSGQSVEVIVNPDHIVKIHPLWYTEGIEGKSLPGKWLTYVKEETIENLVRGVQKFYIVYDALGHSYCTGQGHPETDDFIEKLWLDAQPPL